MKDVKLLFITAILFGITSCSKEEQEVSKGFVKMENKISDLNYGYIDKRIFNSFTQIRIHLSDKKIIFKSLNDWELEPRDNHIFLVVYYPNVEIQDLRDYYPLITESEGEDGTTNFPYLLGSVVIFNITTNPNAITNANFEYRNSLWDNGSLTIDRTNNNYRITFTLKKENQIITGEYIGNLENLSF